MTWHRIQVAHARNHRVEAYLRQRENLIEVFHACESLRICQSAQFIVGEIRNIRLDQNGSDVVWTKTDLPDYCLHPEMDCRHNDIIEGFEPKIADLRYGIANMMNQVFSDRGFSSYAKKRLIGIWICRTSIITFLKNGEYLIGGDSKDITSGTPNRGVWNAGRNQLSLLDPEKKGGVRTQIVQIDDNVLTFHGHKNFLFQKYARKEA